MKKKKRVGRGPGSGHGKTSCRGHKGQRSRSGGRKGRGFEGGQLPLYRRLPKRGFTHMKEKRQVFNIGDLSTFEEEVTPEILYKQGWIKHLNEKIKILGDGECARPLTVKAHCFSALARKKIEQSGGKIIKI